MLSAEVDPQEDAEPAEDGRHDSSASVVSHTHTHTLVSPYSVHGGQPAAEGIHSIPASGLSAVGKWHN